MKQRHKAFYIRLPRLLELYDNIRNSWKEPIPRQCRSIAKYELLILDEWLMYEMSDKDKQFISELMEVRHDTCSTIFCSQYPTEDWYDKSISQH
ncbi:ATP-binding protein [Catenibacterium sp.]|uniref:ATP-binding protein n=1 Tax=Catenibacterium sp. TaxID=2049022 RepID=UPI003995EF0B